MQVFVSPVYIFTTPITECGRHEWGSLQIQFHVCLGNTNKSLEYHA